MTLPNYMNGSIGENAFKDCTNLESVVLGGIRGVGEMIFLGCNNIKKVYSYSGEPPFPDTPMFEYDVINNAILYVWDSSVKLYEKAKRWKDFGSIIGLEDMVAHEIILNDYQMTIDVNQEKEIVYTVLPWGIEEDVYYASGNNNIATVSADGIVKGIMSGITQVTLSCNNVDSCCEVYVENTSSVETITDDSLVHVTVSGGHIHVHNKATNAIVVVYSIQGSIVTETTKNEVRNLANGFYMLTIGGKSFKIKI